MKKQVKIALGLMLLVNGLVLLWSVFGYGIYCETDDEAIMAAILAGIYGEHSPFIVYGNILYGSFLKLLYQLPGNHLNWLIIVHYGMMFLAYIAIGYVMIRRHGAKKGSLYFYSFLLLFLQGSYLSFNFTKASGLTVAAGYCLLFYGMDQKRQEKIRTAAVGIFLVVYGSFSRFQPFLMVSAFAFGVWVFIGLAEWRDKKEWKTFIKRSLPFFAMGILVFGGQLFSDQVYKNDPNWREYLEYNELRSDLLDFGMPDYVTYEEEYRQIGFSENDYHCLKNWAYGDPEFFSKETLEKIVALKGEESFSAERLWECVRGVGEWSVRYLGLYIWLLLLVKLFFGKKRALIGWAVFVSLAEAFYLYLCGRPLDRVTWIVYLGAALFLLQLPDQEENRRRGYVQKLVPAALVLCALVLCPLHWKDLTKHMRYENDVETLEKMQVMRSEGKLYVWPVVDYRIFLNSYNALNAANLGISENSVCLGGWLIESPIYDRVLERCRIDNPFEALLMDEDVFLVGGDMYIPNIWEYLREHFHETANFSIYERERAFRIMAFSYNFENVIPGTTRFAFTQTAWDTEEECIVLEGTTDAGEMDHLYIQIENPVTGELYTFQTKPLPVENGTRFCCMVPQYNMDFNGELRAQLIVEKNGVYESSSNVCSFLLETSDKE